MTDMVATMPERHSIAAVITNYRHGRFLGEAVASVLRQTSPVDRIIVVDDASGQSDENFLGDLVRGVELIRLPQNIGPGGARQVGSDACECDLVAYLDADDLWEPSKIERQYAHLMAAQGASVSHTGTVVSGADGSERSFIDVKPLELQLTEQLRRNQVSPPTVMLWRTALNSVGGWVPGQQLVEDWDLFIRMAAAGHRIVGLREPLTRVRRHGHAHLSSSGLQQIRRLLNTVECHRELISSNVGTRSVRTLMRQQLLNHRHGLALTDRARVVAAAELAVLLPRGAWNWLV